MSRAIPARLTPAMDCVIFIADISEYTEISVIQTIMDLTPVQRRFIVHWGEMGTRWGINRTVAQIHALLFLSPKPLNAEEIASTLGVARSNVSSSLRELQGWHVVRTVHVLGDRRDYFETLEDVWEMFRLIVDERKKREADPTLAVLRELDAQARSPRAADAYTRERLADMRQFFELVTNWMEQTKKLSTPSLVRVMKMGDRIARLVGS
jgi:DNA-binding transcriptional regulator GbsR (MarR family)